MERARTREGGVGTATKTYLLNTREGVLPAIARPEGKRRSNDPPIQVYSYPLEPGKSWQLKYRNTRDDGKVFDNDRSTTVGGWEDVTVPAGTFKALKVSALTYYRRTDGGGGGKIVVNYWYAPEVKRAVKVEDVNIANSGVVQQDLTSELISYKLN